MNIISFIQKKRKAEKEKQQQNQEKFLQVYFSYLYQKQDVGEVAIPYFIKAEQSVADLRVRGLVADVYKQILKKGVA